MKKQETSFYKQIKSDILKISTKMSVIRLLQQSVPMWRTATVVTNHSK